jgi:hypothetical protein
MDNENNCLPDGLDTIAEKIEYVKSCYGIIGENGNLFDWLISELLLLKKELTKADIEELKEILSYAVGGKKIIPDENEVNDIYTKCVEISKR